jgi:hypothetical protein
MLIGDAAGAVSPLTGGGLDPCLRLTQLAVRIAAAYLDSGDARRLDAYTGQPFQRHFIKRRILRRALGAIRHRAVAEAVVLALRGPLQPVAKRIFFGRGSFPDVALIQRGEAGVGLAAGAMGWPAQERRELPVGD